MKRRARDQKNYMVGINTWLFAVGAVLAGYNTYINLPTTVGDGSIVWANFTQKDGIMVSSFAIMMAGFFYSLAILKPDMLKRNRERQLMKLNMEAVHHEELFDSSTELYNGEYLVKILKSYLDEFNAVNETIGLIIIELQSPPLGLNVKLKSAAQAIASTARDYDVVTRLDGNLLAVVTPHITSADLSSISNRFLKHIMADEKLQNNCKLSIGTASNDEQIKTAQALIEAAAKSLQIGKRLNPNLMAA